MSAQKTVIRTGLGNLQPAGRLQQRKCHLFRVRKGPDCNFDCPVGGAERFGELGRDTRRAGKRSQRGR